MYLLPMRYAPEMGKETQDKVIQERMRHLQGYTPCLFIGQLKQLYLWDKPLLLMAPRSPSTFFQKWC